jgi:hypothetical protein
MVAQDVETRVTSLGFSLSMGSTGEINLVQMQWVELNSIGAIEEIVRRGKKEVQVQVPISKYDSSLQLYQSNLTLILRAAGTDSPLESAPLAALAFDLYFPPLPERSIASQYSYIYGQVAVRNGVGLECSRGIFVQSLQLLSLPQAVVIVRSSEDGTAGAGVASETQTCVSLSAFHQIEIQWHAQVDSRVLMLFEVGIGSSFKTETADLVPFQPLGLATAVSLGTLLSLAAMDASAQLNGNFPWRPSIGENFYPVVRLTDRVGRSTVGVGPALIIPTAPAPALLRVRMGTARNSTQRVTAALTDAIWFNFDAINSTDNSSVSSVTQLALSIGTCAGCSQLFAQTLLSELAPVNSGVGSALLLVEPPKDGAIQAALTGVSLAPMDGQQIFVT